MIELNKKAKPLYKKFGKYLTEEEIDCCINIELVGSQAICTPPPGDKSDTDLLCLLPSWHESDKFIAMGWVPDGKDDYPIDNFIFMSVRKGKLNLILTNKTKFFNEFVRAKELCKKINATDKKTRIAIHEFFLDSIGGVKFIVNDPMPVPAPIEWVAVNLNAPQAEVEF